MNRSRPQAADLSSVVVCPSCRSVLTAEGDALSCSTCQRRFPHSRGFLDFAPDVRSGGGLSQRIMENPAIAAIYERRFRPIFTRLGSKIRYADEDRFMSSRFKPAADEAPVLDLACGTGRYLRWIAERRPRGLAIGLDLSFAMLEIAGRGLADLEDRIALIRGSALCLPFADASLAAINCFGALHLFPDPKRALAEVSRCIRPDGSFTCFTAVRARRGRFDRRQRLFSRIAKFTFFEENELEADLDRAGLELVEMQRWQMGLLVAARRLGPTT